MSDEKTTKTIISDYCKLMDVACDETDQVGQAAAALAELIRLFKLYWPPPKIRFDDFPDTEA